MLDRFKGLQLNFLHGLLVVVFLVGIACVEWVINLTSSQYQQLKSNRATTELVGIRSQMEQLFGEVVFRILCHFVKLSKKEMTYDQKQFRHGCRFKAVA